MLSGGTVPFDQPGLFSRETAGEAFLFTEMATFLFANIGGNQMRFARVAPNGKINFYPIFLHHLVKKHDGRCVYCARPVSRLNASVDHVVPKSKGGVHDPSNLTLSCRYCNGAKGNKSAEEFSAWLQSDNRMWRHS